MNKIQGYCTIPGSLKWKLRIMKIVSERVEETSRNFEKNAGRQCLPTHRHHTTTTTTRHISNSLTQLRPSVRVYVSVGLCMSVYVCVYLAVLPLIWPIFMSKRRIYYPKLSVVGVICHPLLPISRSITYHSCWCLISTYQSEHLALITNHLSLTLLTINQFIN